MKPKQRVLIATTDLRENPSACPECGRKLSACTGANFKSETEAPRPEAGDVTLCGYCAAVLIFDSHLIPRLPTTELRARMLADPHVQLFRQFVLDKLKREAV